MGFLSTLWRKARKGWAILVHRLRTQGLRTTLLWVYARGVPRLTGIPLLRYSEVTPQLYVGPQYGRRGRHHLERAGITAGVNLRAEFDDAAHGLALAEYCHLPTVDDDAISAQDVARGVAFVREQIAAGRKVYIHCAGGVGRAPTLAAAYLISTGMTLDEALATIRQARPFINITPPQMALLVEYEAQQRAVPTPAP